MNKLSIIEFQKQYATSFYDLNIAWLEKYFYVEDYDKEVLANPKKYILDKGGLVLFALLNNEAVGTVALINRGNSVYELSKMAVMEKHQGLRIGKKLMYTAISKTIELGATNLYLDSNTVLEPAINLYKNVGFKEIPVPEDTPYERCNIRMEIAL